MIKGSSIIKAAAVLLAGVLLTGCGGAAPESSSQYQLEIVTSAPEAEDSRSAAAEETPGLEVVTAAPTEKPTKAPRTTEAATEAPAEETWADYDDSSYVEYHFRSKKLLNQHFEKHGGEFGSEFGYDTAADYEAGASDVINDPDALHKTESDDGDYVYYIEATNEFVVLSKDGYIRTYFLPSAGKMYYDRQ